MASVSQCLASEGRAVSDQGEVWGDIAMKARRMGVASETGAMADLFEHAGAQIEAYVRAFLPLPEQTGAIFALEGKVVGLELFFSPDTLAKLLPKLVRSYALDAIEIPGTDSPSAPPDSAASFLTQVGMAQVQRIPGTGAGETLRLTAQGLAGVGLLAEGALLHFAAFRTERDGGETPEGPRGSMARASQRFRF